MTKIYLIRHAHVENPLKLNYGRLPGFGLSVEGKEQAKRLSKIFAKINVSNIYSSPLLRTKETARAIAGDTIKISYSQSLIEVDFGRLEGRPIKETLEPRKKAHLINNFPEESYLIVQNRMVKKILQIVKRHKDENVLIVSHADPILTVKLYFEEKPLLGIEKIPVANGSATILTFDDKLQCKKVEYKNLLRAKEDF